MGIAIGGGIDDDLDTFGRSQVAVVEAIVRAEISSGLVGELASGERIELGAVIVRKEDVVVSQWEAIRLHFTQKCHGGKRSRGRGIGCASLDAERTGGKRGAVGVEDDRVGMKPFAVGQLDP